MRSGTAKLAEAAGRPWDAAVVGAGPAGALAAYEVARRGAAVLLVDRSPFPRAKVCGCCLSGAAVGSLRAAGLGTLPARLGAVPVSGFRLAAGERYARVPLAGGVAVSRAALDHALATAAVGAGATFLPGTEARLLPAAGAARGLVLMQNGERAEVRAAVVLAADGLGGRLLAAEPGGVAPAEPGSWIGAGAVVADGPAWYAPGTIFMGCGPGGYVGLVRLEDGRLNVAAAFGPDVLRRGGPGAAAAAVLRQAGMPPVAGLERLPWRGTPALTRRPARRALDRVFALGDAAGYVEPFTGEGMAWALAAAQAVAPLAVRAGRHWEPGLAAEWEASYRRAVARRQAACRVVVRVLRHPLLLAAVIAGLRQAPGLARPLVHHLNRAAP